MRPQFLKISQKSEHSFSTRRDYSPQVNNHWHYHIELELIHFNKGAGTQFIGNSISRFNEGQILLIGKNLPHYWLFDDIYFQASDTATTDVRVVHFKENVFGETFLDLPENFLIRKLMDKAKWGIQVQGSCRERIAGLMEKLISATGPDRIILLLQTLSVLASCPESKKICSTGLRHTIRKNEEHRINMIYDYSLKNFKRKIFLEEIAAIAHISPNSFCRYFKSITGKTYS